VSFPAESLESGDVVRRRRREVFALVVLLAALLAIYFFVLPDRKSGAERANDLVHAGLVAYRQQDYPTARTKFQQAVRADDRNALAHYNLALVQQVVDHNPRGAEAEYRRAIALRPNMAQALFNLAIIRHNSGFDNEAIDLYRRAIRADDALAAAHLNLGLILFERDQASPEAAAEFAKAAQLDPGLARRIPPTATTTTTAP
jgi:tetratricopeptide (TPR) repeat protein